MPELVVADKPSFTVDRAAAAVAGVALGAYGLWVLMSIPHGPGEFAYQNPPGGNAWWPLPYAPANGFTPEQLSSHIARALLLFPACVLLGFAFRRQRPPRIFPRSPLLSIVLGTLVTATIAVLVIRGVPLQDDEATYLMQADLLTRGMVADPTYPMAAAFAEPFTIFTTAGMSGMYLFGEPMVLAVGLPLGLPWLGQWALVALTLWAVFRAAARTGDHSVAWLGTLLLAVSPMLTFTSAGFLSQVPALAGIALAVLGLAVGGWRGGLLVGTGLGLAFVARPQTAGPAGITLLVVYGWRDRRLLAACALAAFPWILAVGVYDFAVMGSPWQLPRAAYTGEMEAYGFGTVIRNYTHTPLKALALAGVTLVRMNGWTLGWPLSLAGPVLWFVLGRPARAVVGPWAAVALATFLFQAGYAPIGISETGAIYHYAALPFFALSTAAALDSVRARPWGGWVHATAAACLLLGTTSFYVEHALRLSRLSAAIEGPRRSLAVELPALIFEDVAGARPQVGWVFGIPFRERSPSAPIVRYPRPTRTDQLHHLMERWKHRHCQYLRYDRSSSQYKLSPCNDIGARP